MMRFQTVPASSSRWMLDSGASNHYTASRSAFVSFRKTPRMPIDTASNTLYGEGIGDVMLHLTCGSIRISDVIFVPDMISHTSLLSVGQLESKGITFTIEAGTWKMWKNGSLWAIASKEHCVYFLQELSSAPSALLSFPSTQSVHRVDTQEIEV